MAWALARSSFMTPELTVQCYLCTRPLTYSPFGDDWPYLKEEGRPSQEEETA